MTDIYEDKDNVYVVMEHVEGGELFTRSVVVLLNKNIYVKLYKCSL